MKRDQIIIFMLVGIMLFSAVATGLLLLAQGGEDTLNSNDSALANNSQQVCEPALSVDSVASIPEGEWPTTVETPVTELQQIDFREGNGDVVSVGNCITVNYRLSLADGTPIAGNDTFAEGTPIAFELNPGALIEGWVQGIPGMKEGGFRRLIVPSALAYGESERPGIPVGSDLIFDVEIVRIEF